MPSRIPNRIQIGNARPARMAWIAYRIGATNMKENSIGSVIPVRNEVNAAEIMIPPTFARFSGLAECQIAIAAAGRPYILNRKPPDSLPAVGSPAI
ncbi:hypothetical protein D3C86_1914880 [compost metagenome]